MKDPRTPDRRSTARNTSAADPRPGESDCVWQRPAPPEQGEGEQLNLSKGRERFRQAGFAEESSQTETTPVPSAPVPAQAGNAWGAAGGRLGGRSRDGSCLRPGV